MVDKEGELFQAALREEAVTLGIQPSEQYLIHFAQESLLSEVPPGWQELVDPASGHAYYLNNTTNESTWHNPTTTLIKQQVERARNIHIQAMQRRQQKLVPNTSRASPIAVLPPPASITISNNTNTNTTTNDDDDDDEDRVEYIVARRIDKTDTAGKRLEYKVHWNHTESTEDEWFHREALINDYPTLLKDFDNSVANGGSSKQSSTTANNSTAKTMATSTSPKISRTNERSSSNSTLNSRINDSPSSSSSLKTSSTPSTSSTSSTPSMQQEEEAIVELRRTIERLESETDALRRELFETREGRDSLGRRVSRLRNDCELMEKHTLKLKNELATEADESANLRHRVRLLESDMERVEREREREQEIVDTLRTKETEAREETLRLRATIASTTTTSSATKVSRGQGKGDNVEETNKRISKQLNEQVLTMENELVTKESTITQLKSEMKVLKDQEMLRQQLEAKEKVKETKTEAPPPAPQIEMKTSFNNTAPPLPPLPSITTNATNPQQQEERNQKRDLQRDQERDQKRDLQRDLQRDQEHEQEQSLLNVEKDDTSQKEKDTLINAKTSLENDIKKIKKLNITLKKLLEDAQIEMKTRSEQITSLEISLKESRSREAEAEADFRVRMADFERLTRQDCDDRIQRHAEVEKANAQAKIDRIKIELEVVQDKYRREVATRRKLHEKCMELEGNIRVFCRSRPVLPVDGTDPDANKVVVQCLPVGVDRDTASKLLLRASGNGGRSSPLSGGSREETDLKSIFLKFTEMGSAHYGRPVESQFEFDGSFPPGTPQANVYDKVQPFVISAVDGYDVCLFAYGQTGSGKTFTMEGGGSRGK